MQLATLASAALLAGTAAAAELISIPLQSRAARDPALAAAARSQLRAKRAAQQDVALTDWITTVVSDTVALQGTGLAVEQQPFLLWDEADAAFDMPIDGLLGLPPVANSSYLGGGIDTAKTAGDVAYVPLFAPGVQLAKEWKGVLGLHVLHRLDHHIRVME